MIASAVNEPPDRPVLTTLQSAGFSNALQAFLGILLAIGHQRPYQTGYLFSTRQLVLEICLTSIYLFARPGAPFQQARCR